MKNFSTVLQTVWRTAQKNSWGLYHPPVRERVNDTGFTYCQGKAYGDEPNAATETAKAGCVGLHDRRAGGGRRHQLRVEHACIRRLLEVTNSHRE